MIISWVKSVRKREKSRLTFYPVNFGSLGKEKVEQHREIEVGGKYYFVFETSNLKYLKSTQVKVPGR